MIIRGPTEEIFAVIAGTSGGESPIPLKCCAGFAPRGRLAPRVAG
jgi:hypothetical protein